MQAMFKKAIRSPQPVDMEVALDLIIELEALGVASDVIDEIMEDYDASQKNNTYRADIFKRDVLDMYRIKDGETLSAVVPVLAR